MEMCSELKMKALVFIHANAHVCTLGRCFVLISEYIKRKDLSGLCV
jgi:hypothetical protein